MSLVRRLGARAGLVPGGPGAGSARAGGADTPAHTGRPVAIHAGVPDGEHLLVAIRGSAVPLVLMTPAGEVELTTEAGADRGGPLTTATVLLTPYADPDPGTRASLAVGVRSGGRTAPLERARTTPTRAAADPGLEAVPTPDDRAVWTIGDEPDLVVHRRPADPHVPVLGLHGRGLETRVLLGPGPADRVEVRRADEVTLTLPLEDVRGGSGARLLRLGRLLPAAAPAPGQEAPRGDLYAEGRPLVRTRSQIARPHRATELPPLPSPSGVELRWTRAGHLVLRPVAPPPSGPEDL